MKLLLPIVACLMMLPAVVACSDDDVDSSYTDYLYDMVTYLDSEGGTARFTLLQRNDSGAITLLADIRLDSNLRAGQRMWLRYLPVETAGSTRRVTAYAATAVNTDSLRYTVKPLDYYLGQMQPVELLSIWRTGGYINLHCRLEYTGKPRLFYLLLDSATRHDDTLRTYLVHNTHNDTLYHNRDAYASFYVGNALRQPACRVLGVTVNDRYNNLKTYYFTQQK